MVSSSVATASLPGAHCVPFHTNEKTFEVPSSVVARAAKWPPTVPTMVNVLPVSAFVETLSPGTTSLIQLGLFSPASPAASTTASSLS